LYMLALICLMGKVTGQIITEPDIREKHAFAPKPDIVLIFDLPVSVALERVKGHSDADEFEKEEHLEKVREAYLDLENDPLVRIVDATRTPEGIFEDVWRLVSEVRND